MEVLHTSYITNAKPTQEDADFRRYRKRNSYVLKTPASTLPV
jgi:hypothetical protein